MGGRALKSTHTRRYERQEFEDIKTEIFEILSKTFLRYDIPRFFSKKETFGDIDIIISMEGVRENMHTYITETFKPNEIFHNGNAWSFDYKELQVDFITVSDDDFDSNYHYLAFNDLGNFIGRLAQSIGFKYGQEGLWYNHYSDSNTKNTIIVSKDYPKIFEFLGLDYDRWLEGFDTLEDIFEYTMTSPLFNPEMFQLSQLNKINRERNLKRASYMAFLEYIKDKPAHEDYDGDVTKHFKTHVPDIIREVFPEVNIDLRLAEIEYEAAKKKLVNMKFNGGILKEKYGLEGREIGDAIIGFKEFLEYIFIFKYTPSKIEGVSNYDTIIIDLSVDEIFYYFDHFLVHGRYKKYVPERLQKRVS